MYDVQAAENIAEQTDKFSSLEFPKKEYQNHLNYLSELKTTLTSEQENELLQKCAVDLCGPAKESYGYIFNNATVNINDIDPETSKRFNEKIRPSIEQAIQAELDYDKKILDALTKKINNQEEWDKLAEVLYKNISVYSLIYDIMASSKDHHQDRQKVYEEARTLLNKKYQQFLKEHKGVTWIEEDQHIIDQLGQSLEKESLSSLIRNIFYYARILDNLIIKQDMVSCTKKPICKKWIYEELSHLHQKMEQELKEKEKKENKDQYLQYCRSIYETDVKDAQQISLFKKNLDGYKNQFLEKAFFSYSNESKQIFEDYMNHQLNINLPPSSRENVERNFIEKIDNIASIFFTYPSLSVFTIAEKVKNKKKRSKNFKICPSPMRKQFKQNLFISYTNTIHIGNVPFHEYGKYILAHELAHAMSNLFADNKLSKDSYKPYLKLRECATNIYKTHNQSFPKFSLAYHHTDTYRDKHKTEEDVGDLVAYQVFQEDPTLIGCSTLSPTKDGNQYKPLKILDTRYYSIDDYYGSAHSEPLLRVIIEAIHKRIELPKSCQQITDIYSDRINFEPCF